MTTLTDRATETSIRIAREIRKLPGIKSVKTAGFSVPKYSEQLYPIALPGQLPANLSNNIGTFEEQVSEGMPHEAYFSVTVRPENALQAVHTIQKKAKSVLAYTNVAGTGVELFFIRTDADPKQVKFSDWDGRHFQEGTRHGKDGAKRYRVRKGLNGRNNGAFMSRQTGESWIHTDESGIEWECASWPLPGNQGKLTIVKVPEPYDANDNDGLVTESAAIRLAAACSAEYSRKTDFVQMLLLGKTGVNKCAAEILRGEPKNGQVKLLQSVPEADIFIGEAGANRNVWLDQSSLGRITLWNRKNWEPYWVTADALQTYLRWRAAFQIEAVLGVGSAMLRAQLRQDQLDAMTTPMEQLQEEALEEWEYKNENSLRSEHAALAWQLVNEAEFKIGTIARTVNGSPFAWNEAIDFRHARVARIVQSMVNENRAGFRNDATGMPAWVIPGQYMMLMHHDFAGVKKPQFGWARIIQRPMSKGYYGYDIDAEDFASNNWSQGSDTSDFDDKSSLTPAVDTESNEVHHVILRRPSSPYGGNIRHAYRGEVRDWHKQTGIPVLPLRPDWKERLAEAERYISLPMGISTGPARTPQPATNDLEAELVANIWAAQQVKEVGLASLIIGVIALSELSDGESKFITSDLIDNSVNQLYNGEYVTAELMDRLLDLIKKGKPMFMPALAKIRGLVVEAYSQKYGHKPVIIRGHFPDHEKVWKHLANEARAINRMSRTLAMRANGIPNHLTEPLDPELYRIAISVVRNVAQYWRQWGSRVGEIRQSERDYSEKETEIAHRSEETNAMIAERVEQGLEEARETYWYIPGNFARALLQTQLTENRRWQKEKKPYKLMSLLDEEELTAFFDPTWYGKADPTWVTRITVKSGCDLKPGDVCTVTKAGTANWAVVKKGEDKTQALLESEGYGIAGLESEFLGFVPIPEDAPAEFHSQFQIAVFRNDLGEIVDTTRQMLKEQEGRIQSFHALK